MHLSGSETINEQNRRQYVLRECFELGYLTECQLIPNAN